MFSLQYNILEAKHGKVANKLKFSRSNSRTNIRTPASGIGANSTSTSVNWALASLCKCQQNKPYHGANLSLSVVCWPSLVASQLAPVNFPAPTPLLGYRAGPCHSLKCVSSHSITYIYQYITAACKLISPTATE